MGGTPLVADGARWALVALFALAIAEKSLTLLRRATAWHPMMLVSSTRRRRAPLLMTVSVLADAAAIVLLVGVPVFGAALTGVLIVTYTWAAMPLHLGGQPADCRCFFKFLNTHTRRGLLARNSWMLLLAAALFVERPNTSWTGGALGGVLLGGTLLAAALVGRAKTIADRASFEGQLPAGTTDLPFTKALASGAGEGNP